MKKKLTHFILTLETLAMKYIDAEKLYKKIDERMAKFAELEKETEPDYMDTAIFYQGKSKMCSEILTLIDSLQQEQPDDLASLISEATNVAKRIVDWDSFYNSLPQNLRNKYTSKAWCEILEALSTMKEQEQSEVDLKKEEFVGVAESPLKTFPRVNEFECGGSYRH